MWGFPEKKTAGVKRNCGTTMALSEQRIGDDSHFPLCGVHTRLFVLHRFHLERLCRLFHPRGFPENQQNCAFLKEPPLADDGFLFSTFPNRDWFPNCYEDEPLKFQLLLFL